MKKLLFFVAILLFACAAEVYAQGAEYRRFEINWNVLSYARQGSVNLYGGSLDFEARVSRSVGIVADLDIHQPEDNILDVALYRFGPRFHLVEKKRLHLFSQVLLGGSRLTEKVSGLNLHDNGFSMYSGAGLDVGIAPWFAWRAVEGGYSGFSIDGMWSNGARVSTGIVFKFGKM